MHLKSPIPVHLRVVAILIVLTLISSGCRMTLKHKHCRPGKAYYQETYGVEDTLCHGYNKTCWRSWNEDAWSTSGCPVHDFIPADSVLPAPATPVPVSPAPVIPPPMNRQESSTGPSFGKFTPGPVPPVPVIPVPPETEFLELFVPTGR